MPYGMPQRLRWPPLWPLYLCIAAVLLAAAYKLI